MLAKKIKEHQKKTGLSLRGIARKAGVSSASLTQWVNGRRNPSNISIRKVCRGLGWGMEVESELINVDEKERWVETKRRHILTDEFWEIVDELEMEFREGLRDVPESDERLARIREIVGAKASAPSSRYDKNKVDEIRKEQGYNGQELSRMMGYSETWYNSTFKISNNFSDDHAYGFAKVLGVSINDLLREGV